MFCLDAILSETFGVKGRLTLSKERGVDFRDADGQLIYWFSTTEDFLEKIDVPSLIKSNLSLDNHITNLFSNSFRAKRLIILEPAHLTDIETRLLNEKGFKLYGYNNLIKVPPRFQRLKKIKEAQGNLDGFDYCYVPKFYKNSVINEVLRLEAFVRNIPEISLSMKDYEPDANLNFLDELAFTPDIFSRNISRKLRILNMCSSSQ